MNFEDVVCKMMFTKDAKNKTKQNKQLCRCGTSGLLILRGFQARGDCEWLLLT